MNKKTLLFDCDGVLYPLYQLPTQKIVSAMKETYRQDLGLSGEEQQKISEETRQNNRLGMFNYIKAMCEYKNYDYDSFCAQMAERIDYSNIEYNPYIAQTIPHLAALYNVGILTNNSRAYLAKVVERVMAQPLEKLEASGVKIFDITATEENGVFWRKQPKGLALVCRRNGYQPAQAYLFDDAPANIDAAKEVGMHGILIDNDTNLEKALMLFGNNKDKVFER